jgi:hypothetical protein
VQAFSTGSVAVVLTINHPRDETPTTVWTLWGAHADVLSECLAGLGTYRVPLDHRLVNPEIAALVLRKDDRPRTILGSWTRDAVPELVRLLPDSLGDLRDDLAARFGDPSRSRDRS